MTLSHKREIFVAIVATVAYWILSPKPNPSVEASAINIVQNALPPKLSLRETVLESVTIRETVNAYHNTAIIYGNYH